MTSRICYFVNFFAVLLVTSTLHAGGFEVGNGGVVAKCHFHSKPVSLDYLLSVDVFGRDVKIIEQQSVEASLRRIATLLRAKAPQLYPHFQNYVRLIYQNTDYKKPYIWKAVHSDVPGTYDQELDHLPTKCVVPSPKVVYFQQAIRREVQDIFPGRGKRIVFYYSPSVLKSLSDVQLSFVLVHEWLWDLSSDIRKNRHMNYILHSQVFELMSPKEVQTLFQNAGLLDEPILFLESNN